MKTGGEVIAAARSMVNDQEPAEYRVGDSEMISFLQGAVAEMRRDRPDLFIGRQRFDTSIIGTDTDLSFLSETHRRQISDKVAARWHMIDDEAALDAGKLGTMTQMGNRP